jgi:type II secretory pathway component PulM
LLRPVTRDRPAGKPVDPGFDQPRTGNYSRQKRRKERHMYIGGGVLALIVIVLLLIWLL